MKCTALKFKIVRLAHKSKCISRNCKSTFTSDFVKQAKRCFRWYKWTFDFGISFKQELDWKRISSWFHAYALLFHTVTAYKKAQHSTDNSASWSSYSFLRPSVRENIRYHLYMILFKLLSELVLTYLYIYLLSTVKYLTPL